LGCLSIILQEYEGEWDAVAGRIDKYHRKCKLEENQIRLRGKVEGLARGCPLLLSKYGVQLCEAYFGSVLEMAKGSREKRQAEDLSSFAQHGLDPADLRDAARRDELLREEDWDNIPVYVLQDFELVDATEERYTHKVTRCLYADLWKEHDRPDIRYQIHCRTDITWWDHPSWNPKVRLEQPKTLMEGDGYCLFIQTMPDDE
jgi:hypothetical protein